MAGEARRPGSASHEIRAAWLLLAPGLATISILFLVPIGAAFLLSLTDFDIYTLGDFANMRFIGLRNYAALLRDPLLWKAMRNTALFLFVGGPLTLGVALAAALLLNSPLARWKGTFRTIFFAPYVPTLVAVAVVFRYLYHPRFALTSATRRSCSSPAFRASLSPSTRRPASMAPGAGSSSGRSPCPCWRRPFSFSAS